MDVCDRVSRGSKELTMATTAPERFNRMKVEAVLQY